MNSNMTAIISATCLALVPFGDQGAPPSVAVGRTNVAAPSVPRSVVACGPNSLFVFLLLLGHRNVSAEEIQAVPVFEDGTSFLALRNAARRLNVDADIRRLRSEDIQYLPLPAIAQFKTFGTSITPHHFCVIYRIASQHVFLIDGTTGVKRSIRRSRLADFWTGYVMIEKRPMNAPTWQAYFCVVPLTVLLLSDAAVLTIFLMFLGRSRQGKWRLATKQGHGVGNAFSLFGLLVCVRLLTSVQAEEPPSPPWRTAERGGLNALFCYLRVHGVSCEYSELVEQHLHAAGTDSCTAISVAQLAGRFGRPLAPASLTIKDLISCSLPILVYMDGLSPGDGAFLLVLSVDGGIVQYFNGPTATMNSMTMGDFRRVWSGIALVSVTRRDGGVACFTGAIVGISLAFIARVCFANRTS